MSLEKKLSQLGKSKDLQPNRDWEKATKHELLLEIHAQNRLHKAQQLTTAERFDLVMMRFARRLMPSLTKVTISLLIVMMGSGTAFAAQASVPGEALWPIKRSMEKAELTLTFNPVKETEVHIKHINKRLSEIDKILETSLDNEIVKPEKIAKKEKAIKQAVSHLEKDIAAVDTGLKIVKEEKAPLEIVELAQKVTEVTNDAVVSLEEQAVVSNDKAIEEALNDVKDINKEVGEAAVSLALEVHETIEAEAVAVAVEVAEGAEETKEQVEITEEAAAVAVVVAEMIADEINQLSDDIDNAQEKVDVIGQVELNSAIKTVEDNDEADLKAGVAEPVDLNESPVLERMTEVKEQPQEAGVILDEAKVLLEEGSLKDALDKIAESKEINAKAETVIEILDEAAVIEADAENTIDGEVIDGNVNPVEQIININVETGEQETEYIVEEAAIELDEDEAIIEESDLE
ncbi:hypothetical protein HOC14_04275 [bacterium]|nr:hypothetical protein [bacterium]